MKATPTWYRVVVLMTSWAGSSTNAKHSNCTTTLVAAELQRVAGSVNILVSVFQE
ncbi:MAG: hypothetical protein M3Y84_12300 [Acidobacteriota bacterium]|nr:hypothetical protein [Acidobacteriota bacterium]